MQNSSVSGATGFGRLARANGATARSPQAAPHAEAHDADTASSMPHDAVAAGAPAAEQFITPGAEDATAMEEAPNEAEIMRSVYAAAGPHVSSFICANFHGNINDEMMLSMARHRYMSMSSADTRERFLNGFLRLAELPHSDDDIMYAFSTPAAPENAKAFFREVYQHLGAIQNVAPPENPYRM